MNTLRPISAADSGVGRVHRAALDLLADDVASMSPEARADRLHQLRVTIDTLEVAFTATLAKSDHAGDAEVLDGARSTASWLRSRLRLAPGDASERVRLARAAYASARPDNTVRASAELRDAPLARAVGAVCSGAVTCDQLRSIARGVKDLPPEPAARAADLLVGLCARVDAARVRYAARYLAHVVDPDGAARTFEAQFQARRASFAPMLDGMWRLEAFADPEGSATLQAALDAAMAPSSADDPRTTTQRRYDALIELARFSLEHGGVPGVGGVRPQILVTCSPESLAGAADATPLPASTLARVACDAAITRVVFAPSGAILDLGRTRRFFTAAQRLALWARDRVVASPGAAPLGLTPTT